MINVAVLQGRLVADPELRTTQSGISVTSFRVAVDRDFSGQDGSRQADFIDIVAWRGTAEFVCKYFVKGQMIVLQGRVQTRSYEDKQGNKRTAVEVVAERAAFCQRDAGPKREYSGMNAPGSAPDRNVESQQRPPQKQNGVGHQGTALDPRRGSGEATPTPEQTERPCARSEEQLSEEDYENMMLSDEDLPF